MTGTSKNLSRGIEGRADIEIHPTAIVAPEAVIGAGSSIGPYSIIGSRVVLGLRNRIASHVVIEGNTTFGDDNQLFQFCSIGAIPQDLKYRGEESALLIGSKNIIREFVTIQPGTSGGGMKTVIGEGNLFMANSHIGHDGLIGDHNVFANSAAIAGHVTVGSYAVIGGLVGIHQFIRLGDGCILGGGTMVSQDIPPFCIGQGDRARLFGINVVGLERRGVSAEEIKIVKTLYRKLFLTKGRMQERLAAVEAESASTALGQQFCTFIRDASRGVTRAASERNSE